MTTTWVAMRATGRGVLNYSLPAGNEAPAITDFSVDVTDVDGWVVSRFDCARAWLDRWSDSGGMRRSDQGSWQGGPIESAYTGEHAAIETINAATIAVAHWALETGWGVHEYNYNAGGIHCAGGAECFLDRADGEEFRGYSSLPAFVAAYFDLVSSSRYAMAWSSFKAGSANGIMELWSAGYTCGPKTRAESTSLVRRVVNIVAARRSNLAGALPTPAQYTATNPDVANRCEPGERERSTRPGGGGGGSGGGLLFVAGLLGLAAVASKK